MFNLMENGCNEMTLDAEITDNYEDLSKYFGILIKNIENKIFQCFSTKGVLSSLCKKKRKQ